jgi:hypothetical protein
VVARAPLFKGETRSSREVLQILVEMVLVF